MALWILLCVTLLLPFLMVQSGPQPNLLVNTNSGPVRGMIRTGFTGKKARSFFGIPYAEPPVGKLRFKPPVPVSPWNDVFDATRDPLPCYQTYTKEILDINRMLDIVIQRPWSEDCLTLNIWIPEELHNEAPVAVFYCQERFLTGTGTKHYFEMSTYSTEVQVVVVTFNYRLGAFGFLSLGTSDVTGNVGLMDQHLALRWVRDNAQAFGGKPSAIFTLGFGDGSASIGYHIILNRYAGLFRTAILIGNTPWLWHTKQHAAKLGISLARTLGCHNESISSQLSCLQTLHPEDIVDTSIQENVNSREEFKPNCDGVFIKEPPEESMKAGRFNNVTVVFSHTGAHSALLFYNLNKDLLSEDVGLTVEGFDEAIRRIGLTNTKTDLEIIRDLYLAKNCRTNTTHIRDQAVQAYSDGLSTCFASRFQDRATEAGLLTFKIVYVVPDPKFPSWMGEHSMSPFPIFSASSLDPKQNYSKNLKKVTLDVMMIAKEFFRRKAKEFAKLVPIYNLEDRPYLHWGYVIRHLENYRTKQCKIWNDVFPRIRSKRLQCY